MVPTPPRIATPKPPCVCQDAGEALCRKIVKCPRTRLLADSPVISALMNTCNPMATLRASPVARACRDVVLRDAPVAGE